MNTHQKKHRGGRRAIGTQIGCKLPPELLAKLDAYAADNWPATRSDAVRALLANALDGGQSISLQGGSLKAQMAAMATAGAAAIARIQDIIAVAHQRLEKK